MAKIRVMPRPQGYEHGNGKGPARVRGVDGRYTVKPPKPKGPVSLALSKHMAAIKPYAPALKHGAYLRLPQEKIDASVHALVAAAPHLGQARYQHALSLLARIIARIEVMDDIYTRHPRAWLYRATSSGKIQISGGEVYYGRLVDEARRLLGDLGLTPASAKALGLDATSPDEVTLNAIRKKFGATAGDAQS